MSLTPRSSKSSREPSWTPRQREVLALLTSGHTNGQIAEELGISLDGAKWHVSEIITKLGVDSREEAAEYWRAHNGMRLRFTRALRALLPGAAWAKAVAAGAALAIVAGVAVMAVIALQQGHGDDSAAASTTATNTSTPAATASGTVATTPRSGVTAQVSHWGSG